MTLILRRFFCVMILIVLGVVGISRCLANPLPVDDYYEGNPIPSTQELSVYFKEEFVNITFSSSKVYVSALYTFMNNNSHPIEMSIQLPFNSLWSNEGKPPEDHVLILNKVNFTYEWKNISLEGIVVYGGTNPFKAIEFQLSFSGYEEKEVWIYYSRDYSISKEQGVIGEKIHYHYTYLVGTARVWNHPVKSAKFQFNIPKSICPSIPPHGDIGFTFEENDAWIIGTLEYSDWIPERDRIGFAWTDSRSLVVPGMGFLSPIAVIVVLSLYYKRRR